MLDEYGLTQKEREFCDYYLESGNAKQSYLDSFGASSKNSAAVLACNLMKQEHIKNYLSIVNEALSSDRLAKAQSYLDSFGASSKNSAAVLACNLMKQEHIKNYLSIVNEALSSDRLAKAEEVLIFYTEIMRDKNQSTGDRLKAADALAKRYALFTQKIEANVVSSGRLKAADALAKRYALFTQKIEANVVSSGNFEINILGDFEDE